MASGASLGGYRLSERKTSVLQEEKRNGRCEGALIIYFIYYNTTEDVGGCQLQFWRVSMLDLENGQWSSCESPHRRRSVG